jgi:hypothetical protein
MLAQYKTKYKATGWSPLQLFSMGKRRLPRSFHVPLVLKGLPEFQIRNKVSFIL